MQELKKKHRKKPKKELDRGAQKEQKNLTDITEEQLKVNIGIVRLGNMIKVIQIVMKSAVVYVSSVILISGNLAS